MTKKMATDSDQQQEALRLKSLAETKFQSSNLSAAIKHAKKAQHLCPDLDGVASMLTAFKILSAAGEAESGFTDWYKIFQVEPFSHINTIRKQYKKLALVLHPDKNPSLGCEEAFKLVGEGFRVLSDKIRRKEYDTRLRIRLQDEKVNDDSALETFWTACSRCRLLHQFERDYLGYILVCPKCKRSFEAVEVEVGDEEDGVAPVRVRSQKLRRKFGEFGSRQKMGSADLERKASTVKVDGKEGSGQKMGSVGLGKKVDNKEMGHETAMNSSGDEDDTRKQGVGTFRRKTTTVVEVLEVLERSNMEDVEDREGTMTLAELQVQAKQKASQKKAKLKEKQKDAGEKERVKENSVSLKRKRSSQIEKSEFSKDGRDMEYEARTSRKSRNIEVVSCSASKKSASVETEKHTGSRRDDFQVMAVDDSDFYDFDKDRVEKSFKKGQVWAMYDDDDGMPRNYALINEVVSSYPFEVKFSWLDLQSNGDEALICWEKMGYRVSCGRFKVAKETVADAVNIFSHVVECERAAREVYRIYPKKGSVWALYSNAASISEGRNLSASDKRCYDIVVFLTSYSEEHDLSAGCLEKVDGFKSIFKRREVGAHAIRFFKKDDLRLLSHQIPARKTSSNEIPDLIRDCWELDPASLPSDLLNIEWER